MARSRGKAVRKTDHGWDKFKARALEVTRGPGVTVGIHAQQGSAEHKPEKGHEAEPLTVLEVAYINEFGLGVPERSFIRAWFDAAQTQNLALAERMLKRILKGEIDLKTALDQMGAKFAGDVQARISRGIPPPNAPSTVAAKGSSKPLIWSGQMRQSVTFKTQTK